MDDETKQQLVGRYTMAGNGEPAHVAGWKNDYATVSLYSGGFYHADWEAIQRAADNGRVIQRNDIAYSSGGWLGFGPWPPRPDRPNWIEACSS